MRYAFVDTPRYPPADEQPLAVDKVRYIGDEVAVVVADSEAIAEKALMLIEVEYEILPAVFTAEKAMEPDAPVIHDEQVKGKSFWEDWGVAQGKKGRATKYDDTPKVNNLSGRTFVSFGDVEQGFLKSDYIREDSFSLKATAHCQMEPHAAVASYDHVTQVECMVVDDGVFLKDILSKTLNIPVGRVHHTYLSGAFWWKIVAPMNFVAYLSIKLGRQLKSNWIGKRYL